MVTREDTEKRSDGVGSTGAIDRPASSERETRTFRVAAATIAVLVCAAGLLLSTSWLHAEQKMLLSVSVSLAASAMALGSCLWAARSSSGRTRRFWLIFAAAGAMLTVGTSFHFYYQVLASGAPFPSVADFCWAITGLVLAAGLLGLAVGGRERDDRSRVLLDGLSIGASVLLISQHLVIEEVFAGLGSGIGAVVLAAFPLGDVLLASLAILLLSRFSGRLRGDLILLALGLLVYAVADTAYALLGARGLFETGTPWDLGWIAGTFLWGLAALTPSARSTGTAPLGAAATSRLGALLVYGTFALAMATCTFTGVDSWFGAVLTGALLIIVGARQVVLAGDNDALRWDLEAKVAARTEDLATLARRHERILDAVGEGIYGVDVQGRISFVNPAGARLLGYEPDELLGRDAHATFHVDQADPAGSECHLDAALRGGEVVRRSDETYVRRDGVHFPAEITAAPQQDGTEITGAVVVFSNISARRAIERMKEEFVSVVSHELRTPLTSIRGSLGLLAGGAVGPLPTGAERMVRIALDNSDRLTRLINDILDMERIESGALPMEFAVRDCADLVSTTVTALRPVADDAGVVLVAGPAQGRVHADADRIVQALTNLVGNAVKFSPRGGRVTVSAELGDSHVTFRVEDEGRGVPADKLESIFGRFQQVDSTDSREKGGTGLGLAITKAIVDRHGGRIWAESELGKGSVFRFTLPPVLEPAEALDGPRGQDGAAPRVLLCDDDPEILEVLGRLLREHGYAPTLVARGQDAIDLAVAEHPDVVLLDLRMPGMSGWEAIKELKGRSPTRDIPIVVMSALAPAADPELAERTDGWLTKPVDEERMDRVLAAAIFGKARPTVLIVEDDDDLAAVLVTMFERRGLRTVRSATQHDAVEQTRRQRPDVIVLDLFLPEGDGYGVVEELRRDGRLRSVPVVVYSAAQLDMASRERLRLGEMTFLTKGHDPPEKLARRVVRIVHRVARTDADEGVTAPERSP
jgi:PAS domain S-box-containing protein